MHLAIGVHVHDELVEQVHEIIATVIHEHEKHDVTEQQLADEHDEMLVLLHNVHAVVVQQID